MLKVSFLCIWVICILVCGVKAFFSFQLRLYDFFEDWLFFKIFGIFKFFGIVNFSKTSGKIFC